MWWSGNMERHKNGNTRVRVPLKYFITILEQMYLVTHITVRRLYLFHYLSGGSVSRIDPINLDKGFLFLLHLTFAFYFLGSTL